MLWEQDGLAWVGARVHGNQGDPNPPGPHAASDLGPPKVRLAFTNADGLFFGVRTDSQSWVLSACVACVHSPAAAFAHGPLPASVGRLALDTWHTLTLEVSGTTATGSMDGHALFTHVDISEGQSHGALPENPPRTVICALVAH